MLQLVVRGRPVSDGPYWILQCLRVSVRSLDTGSLLGLAQIWSPGQGSCGGTCVGQQEVWQAVRLGCCVFNGAMLVRDMGIWDLVPV